VFVACSRFVVSAGADEVVEAFRRRPHAVDSAPGFIRMEVVSPLNDPNEFRLTTYWTDEQSFRSWFRSHAFKESHRLIPRGLRLVRGSTRLECFESVSD
jgi:heme-degrading monooxygenase HmoA